MEIGVRNHEHYMDLTAYHALKNIEKENNMTNRTGEIWTADINGIERYIVVVKDHDNGSFVTGCLLQDTANEYKTWPVRTTAGIYYTQLSMLTYFFESKLLRYDRTLTDDEYGLVMAEIASLFGFSAESDKLPAEAEKIDQADEQSLVDDLRDDIESLRTTLYVQEDLNDQMEKKLIRLEAERDVYKDLYMQAVMK